MVKTNTKDLFIDAASSLFACKGYNATGISEILKQSNAPKGSLYYHFPQGKEQLADEALQLSAEKIFVDIEESLNKFDDPIRGFQDHLYCIAKKIEQDMFAPNISISLMALETYSFSERLRQRCEEIFGQIQQIYVNRLIKSGMQEETAKFFAMTMVILTEGAITLCLTHKSVQPLSDLADKIVKLFNNQDI